MLNSVRSSMRSVAFTALAAMAVWSGLPGPAGAAEPAPVAEFFRRPAFVNMVMSPNGQWIAATVTGASGRVGLLILDPRDLSKSKNAATFNDADVHAVHWVDNDRLVFDVTDRRLPYGDQRGSGLFTVAREGSDAVRRLIQRERKGVTESTNIVDRALPPNHALHSVLRDGSSDVVIERHVYSESGQPQGTTLLRLNTRTGLATNLAQGSPEHVIDWTLDAQGVPRVVLTQWADKAALYWKATADKPWTLVREYKAYSGNSAPTPIFVDASDTLYLRGRSGATTDTSALLRVDMRSGKLEEAQTLLALDGYDFSGSLVRTDEGKVLGIHYLTDARATHWFDPALAQAQKQVDALLPGFTNRLDCGQCESPARLLVVSQSDRQPTVFRLFDVKAGTLSELAAARPWIKPATMATRDLMRITTRDGLRIPVHVTRPTGQRGPAPMIVLVHGGPWVRGGEWRWYAESQFLASRGYVVIEPEFRGSTGFGDKLYRAGFKQWGLAMQDDVADATQWAIKQGHADPKRVCIAGASYGGYATLMGLIRHPELYRCGFQWVGVTDIDLMYSINWSDFSENWKGHGMPALIGDREKDAAQLAATSPIKLAAKLTQPLLMAYGGVDRRVPIEHGIRMRDALRPHNKQVEWIDYPSEGHGWSLQANDIDFWTRVEKFLERNLKDAP